MAKQYIPDDVGSLLALKSSRIQKTEVLMEKTLAQIWTNATFEKTRLSLLIKLWKTIKLEANKKDCEFNIFIIR